MIRLPVAGLIAGMAVVTYATRYTMIALLGRWALPSWARRWLEFVPVAALTAIIVPSVLAPQGFVDIGVRNHHVWAAVVGALVAWRTRHTLATIVAALAAFWLLRAILG